MLHELAENIRVRTGYITEAIEHPEHCYVPENSIYVLALAVRDLLTICRDLQCQIDSLAAREKGNQP